MPRIIGVDIPERKPLKIALRYIYGIGPHIALEICKRCNLDPDLRVNNLTEADIGTLNSAITDGFMVEGDLRRQVAQNIRRLTSINCYRGMRHRRSLPVRGQRTKTNARTRKGRKLTVGAIRDKATRKLV
jgi:small subunit ribosomal protein S13